MEIRNLILKALNDFKEGSDIHNLAVTLSMESSDDFKILIKTLNELEDENLIYRDNNDIYHDLDNSDIKEGTVIIRYNGEAFIDKEYGFISSLNSAMHLDKVLYKRDKNGIKVLKIIKRNTSVIIGTIEYYRHQYHFYSDDKRLRGFKITNLNKFKLKNKTKVKLVITDYYLKEARIDKIIGNINDARINEESIVESYNVPRVFSDNVLKEANHMSLNIDYDKRKDLSDLLTITIDGDSAKDFDDAISLYRDDKYHLYVHIADVSYYVKEGSLIDKSAKERGTSIYYTDRVIPMLPEVLSNDLCSLVEGKERLVLTCELIYDLKGNLVDNDFYPAIIKSNHRMTYSNVNKILKGDETLRDKYHDLIEMLEDAKELSDIFDQRKKKRGAISFDDDEAEIVLNDEGKVIDIKKRIRGLSEVIIENFMIEANVAVASYMKNLDLPMIYRNHPKPKQDKIDIFFDLLYSLDYKIKGNHYDIHPQELAKCLNYFKGKSVEVVVSNILLRSMAKALYEENSGGHFGLNLEDYCHFTSPIRRYPDLVVHRMLRKYVFKANFNEYDKDKKRMGEIAELCSEKERRAISIERDVRDARMAEYMQTKVGKVFSGIISSVTSYGFYVKLDNTVEGLVSIRDLDDYYTFDERSMVLYSDHKTYSIGDRVKVVPMLNTDDKLAVNFLVLE